MTGYWDRNGRPITLERWRELFADFEGYRLVKRTPVEDGSVITAWLGFDGTEGPGVPVEGRSPLIFGTLLPNGDEFFTPSERYARDYHDHKVKWYACRDNGGLNKRDEQTAAVHERINRGETLTMIADELGITSQALGRRLRRYRERVGVAGREPYPGNRFEAKRPGAYRMTADG